MINEVLVAKLTGIQYNAEQCGALSQDISEEIRARLKGAISDNLVYLSERHGLAAVQVRGLSYCW